MDNSISLISKIRDRANNFIVNQLEKAGIQGVVPSHGAIIAALLKSGQLTKKELAEKIGKDKSTVTVLVDKLEKAGYLQQEKSMADSRFTVISLTEKTDKFKYIFDEISSNMYEIEYQGITQEEREIFLQLLEKIASNFMKAGY